MRGVTALELDRAGRRLGEQVAADVARRKPHAAQAGDQDVGEVLAHALALRQRFECRRIDLGALALVAEVAVNAVHQVDGGCQQTVAGAKAGPGVGAEFSVARHHRGGKDKFVGRLKTGMGLVTKVLSHRVPAELAARQKHRLGEHLANCQYPQLGMRDLQREETAAVAKHVPGGVEMGGFRADLKTVAQQGLGGTVQRCQIRHVLRRFHRRSVFVHRLVGNLQLHADPRL